MHFYNKKQERMIHLISTFYVSAYSSHLDNERTEELIAALQMNLANPLIELIHLFVDNDNSLELLQSITVHSRKVVVIEVGKKPTYSDFFRYILQNLKNHFCMIANADIYLLDSQEYHSSLLSRLQETKTMYCLTRHEYDMTHPLIDNYCGSHDCYLFHSSYLDQTIVNVHTDWLQNYPGIETHIIKTFCDAGFVAKNPCWQIRIVHLHRTQLRNHGQWIGLHECDDFATHISSCWWVPPVTLA
jgi:hypothetical protein